jgi:outer membrane lipoprotein SlyB
MSHQHRLRARLRGAALILAAASLPLGGCATSGYEIAADDPCGAYRAELKSVEDSYVEGAVLGALGGALIGGLAGGLIGGDSKGALIGVGAGAVAGGLGGYFLAKQNATSDRATLVSSVYGDIAAENAKLDRVTAAFRQIRQCRLRSAEEVKRAFAAREIERPAAEARLAAIRQLYSEDIRVAEALGGKMNERGQEFEFASSELLKEDPAAQREVQRLRAAAAKPRAARPSAAPAAAPAKGAVPLPQRRPEPPQAPANTTAGVATLTESNQLKRQAFSSDVQQAKAEVVSAFELEGSISRIPGGANPLG